MDVMKENVNPNPRDKANPLSVLFFTYTLGMFKRGYRKTLEVEDLYNPINSDRSMLLGDRLERNWYRQIQTAKRKHKKPSLLKALVRTFWPEYTVLGIIVFAVDVVLKLIQPLLLGKFLSYFSGVDNVTREDAFMYAGLIVAISALTVLFLNQFMIGAFHYGMKLRIAACSLVYRKALRLSKTALGETASGKIVNLLSNDVSRFDIVSIFIHHMWADPLSTILIGYFLYAQAGFAGIIGFISVLTVVPLQGYTGKLSAIYRKATAMRTDERVRLMDEIIGGVQVIKMYAWEKPFAKLIQLARKSELKIIMKSSYVRALFMTFNLFTTRLAMFCTLLTMTLTDQPVTAAKVFVFMSYYAILAQSISSMFVRGISEVAELLVGIKRLEGFMNNAEYSALSSPINNNHNNHKKFAADHALNFDNLTVKWSPDSTEHALKQMNLNVPRGKLLGVIGPVGSGKSSLLQTILGELVAVDGNIEVNGLLSYASQDAWVFAATVRQNILFGSEYNKTRYNEVVHACALEKDFKQFPHSDLTVVGDRGASLSGGQKARINLARAIYRDADIYLLDDPLSAVDTHVSKHLYEKCIKGYLAGKTRILVTHQVHHLKDADHIVILNNGSIENEGSFQELAQSENLYAKLLTSEPEAKDEEKQKEIETKRVRHRKMSARSIKSIASAVSEMSLADAIINDVEATVDDDDEDAEDVAETKKNLKEMQETSSKGTVGGSLLFHYCLAGNNICFVIIVMLLYLLAQGLASMVDWYVSFFVNIQEARNNSTLASAPAALLAANNNNSDVNATTTTSVLLTTVLPTSTDALVSLNRSIRSVTSATIDFEYLSSSSNPLLTSSDVSSSTSFFSSDIWTPELLLNVYGGLIVMLFVITMSRSILFYKMAMWSSQKLHDMMFSNIVMTTMRFFDTNPSGRILNRFSKDIGAVDELLPKVILDSAQILLSMVGSLVLITVVNPYFLIMVGIVGIFSMILRHIFLKTSKNIKRLEGVMRSPVFTHLNATLQGLTTIRAYNAENVLRDEFDKHQDSHTSAWFMFIAASSAFGFYMDLLCFILVSIVTFSFLTFGEDIGLTSGEVGLAITQATALTGMVQWGLRQSAEVSNQLMSVERVLEYKNLESEKQPEQPKTPPKEWPAKGAITFEDMGLKYFEGGPLVLKHLNISIQSREKVGIVGRTGAGKSSLISALFRLANVEGSVIIDGLNTGDLSLETLRSSISIIPQDPVLFSGTLRYNLDPFEEYNDEVLYKAIEDVELKDPANIINRLENRVMDRGANYSVGQRQLICLARAIVRNNKILMLDEATANVDPQTDALIQKTIRKKFADCTVLTVAHRLNTIMDSDKVLVMDYGTMVEYDDPHTLLQIPNGVFHSMVAETGRAMSEQLKRIAKEAHTRHSVVPE